MTIPFGLWSNALSGTTSWGDPAYKALGWWDTALPDHEPVTLSAGVAEQAGDAYGSTTTPGAGYCLGGVSNDAGTAITGASKLAFSNETFSSLSAAISAGLEFATSLASSSAGYFPYGVDGDATPYGTTAFKLTFASESVSSSSIMPVPRLNATGVSASTIGYCVGGSTSTTSLVSTAEIDGIQFASDTSYNPSSALATAKDSATGLSSSLAGYIAGGLVTTSADGSTGTTTAGVVKLLFSSEAVSASAYALSSAAAVAPGLQSSAAGFVVTGVNSTNGSGTGVFSVQSVDFSSDATTVTSASVTDCIAYAGGSSHGDTAGYAWWGSGVSSIIKLAFATQSISNPACSLTSSYGNAATQVPDVTVYVGGVSVSGSADAPAYSSAAEAATTSEASAAGFYAAVEQSESVATSDTIDSISAGAAVLDSTGNARGYSLGNSGVPYTVDFVTEALSYLSASRNRPSLGVGAAFSTFAAYFAGADFTTGTVAASAIDKLSFGSDTFSETALSLTQTTSAYSHGVSSSTAGYFSYGYYLERLTFSGEALTTLSATMSSTITEPGLTQSSTVGYFLGSAAPVATGRNKIQKLIYASETVTEASTTLTVQTTGSSALCDYSSYAYSVTGYNSSAGSYISAITTLALTGDAVATASSALVTARYRPFGMSASSKGYVGGGMNSDGYNVLTVEGVTYSGVTVATLSATLAAASQTNSGVALNRYGVGPSMGARDGLWADGLTDLQGCGAGYVAGGAVDSFSGVAMDLGSILRFHYATESSGIVTTAAVTPRTEAGGMSSAKAGYVLGGRYSTTTINKRSDVSKFAYSTETISSTSWVLGVTLSGSFIAVAQFGINTLSSPSKGYTMGGYGSIYIDTITFSTDTFSTVGDSLYLPGNRGEAACVSSSTVGYAVGGFYSGSTIYSSAAKLVYSTEAVSTVSSALGTARLFASGTSSTSTGYSCGGQTVSSASSPANLVDSMVFATEASATLSATLSTARVGAAGFSATSYGYICGGTQGGAVGSSALSGYYNVVDRVTYSGSSVAALSSGLAAYTGHGAAFGYAGYNATWSVSGSDGATAADASNAGIGFTVAETESASPTESIDSTQVAGAVVVLEAVTATESLYSTAAIPEAASVDMALAESISALGSYQASAEEESNALAQMGGNYSPCVQVTEEATGGGEADSSMVSQVAAVEAGDSADEVVGYQGYQGEAVEELTLAEEVAVDLSLLVDITEAGEAGDVPGLVKYVLVITEAAAAAEALDVQASSGCQVVELLEPVDAIAGGPLLWSAIAEAFSASESAFGLARLAGALRIYAAATRERLVAGRLTESIRLGRGTLRIVSGRTAPSAVDGGQQQAVFDGQAAGGTVDGEG